MLKRCFRHWRRRRWLRSQLPALLLQKPQARATPQQQMRLGLGRGHGQQRPNLCFWQLQLAAVCLLQKELQTHECKR